MERWKSLVVVMFLAAACTTTNAPADAAIPSDEGPVDGGGPTPCASNDDCLVGWVCGPEQQCVPRVCTAPQNSCLDRTHIATCSLSGASFLSVPCDLGWHCEGGRCVVDGCVPGREVCHPTLNGVVTCTRSGLGAIVMCENGMACFEGNCDAPPCEPGDRFCDRRSTSNARLECNAGGGLLLTPCADNERCSEGECVVRSCTPGAAACASASSRRVCNPDGLSFTTGPCPVRPNAIAATCSGAGECGFTCAPGFGDCDGVALNGCETSLTTAEHCGSCDRECISAPGAHGVCEAGVCREECDRLFADCDGIALNGCEAIVNRDDQCGACGVACPPGQFCVSGVCSRCRSSEHDCGGTCVNLDSDPANCGACGHACDEGVSCLRGRCVRCDAGQTVCNGFCDDLMTSTANCGRCGNSCPPDATCQNGACDCSYLAFLCRHPVTCRSFPAPRVGCGRCEETCTGGTYCTGGFCEMCAGIFTELCGDECVFPEWSREHCGACGHACGANEVCFRSECRACPEGAVMCGDRCVDVRTNPDHCGACYRRCRSDHPCLDGRCVRP